MKSIRLRLFGALVCLAVLLFAGCSQVGEPVTPPEEAELEDAALTVDWVDTSSDRGSINGSGSLSALRWSHARNGWGPVERNSANGGRAARDGATMVMKRGVYGGQSYSSGFGVYANSVISFKLDGRCSVFTSAYGLDKTASDDARVSFRVFADGKKIFEDANNGSFRFELGVAGVNRLTLVVRDLNPAAKNKSANWGDPSIACTPAQQGAWTDTSAERGPVVLTPGETNISLGSARWVSASNGRGPIKRENSDLTVYPKSDILFDLGNFCVGKNLYISTRLDGRPVNGIIPSSTAVGRIYATDSYGAERSVASVDLGVNRTGGYIQVGSIRDATKLRLVVTDANQGAGAVYWASPTIGCYN